MFSKKTLNGNVFHNMNVLLNHKPGSLSKHLLSGGKSSNKHFLHTCISVICSKLENQSNIQPYRPQSF